jgi:D-alanyl-D-alanine carboxypeptidase
MQKKTKLFALLLIMLAGLFFLSACSQGEEKAFFSETEVKEMQDLPVYKIWLGQGYLKLELQNEAEHLISTELLKIAFPRYAKEFPELDAMDYIRPSVLSKVPGINVKLTEKTFEAGQPPEDELSFTYVNLKWQEPMGYIFLVNKQYKLDENYEDQSLQIIKSPVLEPLYYNMRLSAEALENLEAMAGDFYQATKKPMILVSTYRDYAYQAQLFNKRIASNRTNFKISYEEAYDKAAEIIAIPGTSEHQTGLAIDFSNKTMIAQGKTLVSDFSKEPEGKWLYENANQFGFILRYPKDKTPITEIVYEPWHYRYVGQPHAEIIFANQWCLEEYLDFLSEKEEIISDNFSVFYLQAEKFFSHEIYFSSQLKIENDNKNGWVLSYLKNPEA